MPSEKEDQRQAPSEMALRVSNFATQFKSSNVCRSWCSLRLADHKELIQFALGPTVFQTVNFVLKSATLKPVNNNSHQPNHKFLLLLHSWPSSRIVKKSASGRHHFHDGSTGLQPSHSAQMRPSIKMANDAFKLSAKTFVQRIRSKSIKICCGGS